MKKRIITAIILVLSIMISACSSSTKATEKSKSKKKQATKQEEYEDVDDEDEDAVFDDKSDEDASMEPDVVSEKEVEAENAPVSNRNYVISDEVIVDNEQCKVTIISGDKTRGGDVEFKMLLENKTADKTLMYSIDDAAVNGWMIEPFFVSSIAAGKKANETLTFYESKLADCNITSIDKMEFQLRVYDYDDWSADEFVDDTFVIYPTGLSESEIVIPERWYGQNEKTIVDNDQVTFVILGSYIDDIWGFTLVAYIENKTDKQLMFSWDDVSVNGFMVDPFFATTVTSGNRELASINFSDRQFDENGITEVQEIEFKMRAYNYDDWMADDIVNEVFTYTPSA